MMNVALRGEKRNHRAECGVFTKRPHGFVRCEMHPLQAAFAFTHRRVRFRLYLLAGPGRAGAHSARTAASSPSTSTRRTGRAGAHDE